ncbi:GatB/YqeY domain-containing protein [Patescibacteria group bacterium]|nr:GatB/YqeY domain-containing protein [Patescibacteria group bacterium]
MKSNDTLRLSVLRYLLAQIKNKEIDLRTSKEELGDAHVAKILKKELKKRREVIELAEKARREDVVERETSELNVLKEFCELLPDYEF